MHRRNFLVAVTLLVVPCFAQTRRPDPPVRQPVRGTHGAVAAGSDWATNAGMRLYDQGGTAVDAGVATMFGLGHRLSHFGMGGELPS
jgi:gamma-glutamyltranspeptidase